MTVQVATVGSAIINQARYTDSSELNKFIFGSNEFFFVFSFCERAMIILSTIIFNLFQFCLVGYRMCVPPHQEMHILLPVLLRSVHVLFTLRS
jgi:hypothetical protein